jgi:hypothetical protein
LPATVRFKEDGTNLYVGVTVPDSASGTNPTHCDRLRQQPRRSEGRQGTTTGSLSRPSAATSSNSPTGTGGASHYNDTTDPATGGPGTGTNDTVAAGSIGAGQVTFEMAHPLCSTDTAHDICASPGQTLGVDFQYQPDSGLVFYNAPGPGPVRPQQQLG